MPDMETPASGPKFNKAEILLIQQRDKAEREAERLLADNVAMRDELRKERADKAAATAAAASDPSLRGNPKDEKVVVVRRWSRSQKFWGTIGLLIAIVVIIWLASLFAGLFTSDKSTEPKVIGAGVLPPANTVVADTKEPTLIMPISSFTWVADSNIATGAVVDYPVIVATDDTTLNPFVWCDPQSKTMFPIGLIPVKCIAIDNAGNVGYETFDVNVTLPDAPKVAVDTDKDITVHVDINCLCVLPAEGPKIADKPAPEPEVKVIYKTKIKKVYVEKKVPVYIEQPVRRSNMPDRRCDGACSLYKQLNDEDGFDEPVVTRRQRVYEAAAFEPISYRQRSTSASGEVCVYVLQAQPTAVVLRNGSNNRGKPIVGWKSSSVDWQYTPRGYVGRICMSAAEIVNRQAVTLCGESGHSTWYRDDIEQMLSQGEISPNDPACLLGTNQCARYGL